MIDNPLHLQIGATLARVPGGATLLATLSFFAPLFAPFFARAEASTEWAKETASAAKASVVGRAVAVKAGVNKATVRLCTTYEETQFLRNAGIPPIESAFTG